MLNRPPASVASISNKGITCLSTSSRWIVNSGATHHITSMKPPQYLDSLHPMFITVTNDTITPVSGSADIPLNPSISLRSVLHVPSSLFNLLSVSRLTADLNCSITFTPSSFLMHDRQTQSIIGKERLQNGLYFLDISPTILSSVSSVD
ncbi:hypothetical protein KSP39_PZI021058 [Platanthera zijinensis]|uniref:Retrovirus-related Pol polyprotein from transposon TNT 1-94-like beta-barrel domain-containing protein n=1 Tax=Platanthera zijinensis TaxID=2320716 RepID=A0AAP0AY20_9ASPA